MKWRKLGRVFDPTKVEDRPWMQEFAQCTSTLLFDDFVRVYFSCRPRRSSDGQYVSNTAFLDLDRRDLTQVIRIAQQPLLELGELGTFDEFGIYPSCVTKLGDSVHFYYAGWTRMVSVPVNVAIGVAFSKDGEHFERLGKGPIMSRTPEAPFLVSGPKVRIFDGNLYMFYIAGEKWLPPKPVICIAQRRSTKFVWQHRKTQSIGKGLAKISSTAFWTMNVKLGPMSFTVTGNTTCISAIGTVWILETMTEVIVSVMPLRTTSKLGRENLTSESDFQKLVGILKICTIPTFSIVMVVPICCTTEMSLAGTVLV